MGAGQVQFCGEFEHTLDAKGRVSVPARFREALRGAGDGEVVVLCSYLGMDRCVTIFGLDAWQEALEQIDNKPGIPDDERAALSHVFRHGAKIIPMDDQGRLVLPPEARDYASLPKDVMIVGDGRKLHILDRETYRRVARSLRAVLEANPKMIRVLDI